MNIILAEFTKILIVAKYTAIELYKSKILFNSFLIGIGIAVTSFIASEFTYGVPEKIALDFGIGALTISGIAIAIFMGVNLIAKELEQRTVYMIISRPIKRSSFLIGRTIGMMSILMINILILSFFTIGFFLYLGGDFSPLIAWSCLFAFFEASIMLLVVILLSLLTNVTMSVIYAITIYILGHASTAALSTHFVKENSGFASVIKGYGYIFPNFYKLNITDHLIYDQNLPFDYLLGISGYAIFYILFLIVVSSIVLEKKELN